jgi:hypothetical protein
MMNRISAIILCLVLLASGLIASSLPYKEEIPVLDPSSTDPGQNLSLDSFVLDISPMLFKLEELSPDDRPDQLADWALYGTLARTSISSDDLRKVAFNLAPFRFPFLEEVLDFDYGPGRRAFLPDGSVWLFYSTRDKQPQVTLARLADQVRMERGELPASLTVFRYRTELPEGAIYVEREKIIPAQKLFSPDYGYVERTVSTAAELGSWLEQIDDVTHVRKISGNAIEIGGRHFEKTRTLGVTLEDVAALYQAHSALAELGQEPGFSLDPQWDVEGLIQGLRLLLEDPAQLIRSAQVDALIAQLGNKDESAQRRVSSTALEVDYALQYASIGRLQLPQGASATILEILDSIEGKSGIELEEGAIVPFLRLQEDMEAMAEQAVDPTESSQAILLLTLLDHLESQNRAQCARYDGPLQGTRVGMNLFYTDLLAKLWASVDYYRAAPVGHIYGFSSQPVDIPYLEPTYWAELWALPSTRLWFGPNQSSYKGAPDDPAGLNFAHISARVYSAGSNPLNPGEEVTPNEPSRRAFGWWDRHFAAVADYEQQYHVQNQIMKWSVIAGWLESEGLLDGLKAIEVNHSLRFDHWYKVHRKDLRFGYSLPMLPEDRRFGDTECLEILRSYSFAAAESDSAFIEGGVSLGSSRSVDPVSRYSSSIPHTLRRGSLDNEKSALDQLVNLKKVSFEFPAIRDGYALVDAKIPPDARLRMGGTELPFKKLRTGVSAHPRLKKITLEADDLTIGTIRVDTTTKGNRLIFEDASLLRERALLDEFAGKLARGETEASMLGAEDALLPPTGHYVVELKEGQVGAIHLGSSGAGGGGPPPRIFRTTDPSDKDHPGGRIYLQTIKYDSWGGSYLARMEAAVLTRKEALEAINRCPWQRLRPLADREMPGQLERVFVGQGPTGDAIPIKIKTSNPLVQELEGYFGDGGVLYLRRPTTTDARINQLFDDLVVDAGLHGKDIQFAWETKQKTLDLEFSSAAGRGIKAAMHLREGRYAEGLAELRAASQEGHLQETVEVYQEQLSSYFSEGQLPSARVTFAKATSLPAKPVTRLAEALDALHRQRPAEAAKKLQVAVAEAREWTSSVLPSPRSFREVGSEAANEFVEARLGQVAGLSSELASKIRLEPVGNRLHTVVDLRALAPGRPLSRAEQARIVQSFSDSSPDRIYIEDSVLLNKFDWDGAPGPSLSEIRRSPDFAWMVLDVPEAGVFRPSVLQDGNTRLIRREFPQLTPRLLEPVPRELAQRFYIVRSCDRNGDAVVSKAERAGCGGEGSESL